MEKQTLQPHRIVIHKSNFGSSTKTRTNKHDQDDQCGYMTTTYGPEFWEPPCAIHEYILSDYIDAHSDGCKVHAGPCDSDYQGVFQEVT